MALPNHAATTATTPRKPAEIREFFAYRMAGFAAQNKTWPLRVFPKVSAACSGVAHKSGGINSFLHQQEKRYGN